MVLNSLNFRITKWPRRFIFLMNNKIYPLDFTRMIINCFSAVDHKTLESKEWVQVSKEHIPLTIKCWVCDELPTGF